MGILPHSKLLAIQTLGKFAIVSRFKSISNGWGYGGSKDAITFKVSSPIRIAGCGIYNKLSSSQDDLHGTINLF